MEKKIFWAWLVFLPLLALSCSQDCKVSDDSVIIKVGGPQTNLLRLQVVNERTIRVSATPDRKFADKESLVVLPHESPAGFMTERSGDTVSVRTSAITAKALVSTGEVWFEDTTGTCILRELEGGGKSFVPIRVEGTRGYSVRQVFESPDDESFYGLGQHQADEFNYKSRNEELFQYNTKVSVPFIVSDRNYGILLDSYSLCRFGNPSDYSQLGEVFRLYDRDGKEGALTGTYIPDRSSGAETLVRREDSLYFEHLVRGNLDKVVNLPENFPLQGAEVLYEGEIEPLEDGLYHFILYYAGYVKVFLDGRTVVPQRWRTAWNPNSYKFTADLKKGQRVPLRIEWDPDGVVSYCGLRVMQPVPVQEQGMQSWWSEMSAQLDYYFIYGDDMDGVISGYRTLTGKAPIMPKWAMGYWQSRERYKTADEITDVLAEFRRRKIPVDNIVLDWSYWPEDAWGSHDFDSTRFPDPAALVDSVHSMNARMMISVWPKFYVGTDNYKAFEEKGWMYPLAVTDSIRDWIGKGYLYSFYDAYSPDARRLFWNQMYEKLYPLGIDAWWMDASEPNIRDCTDMQYRKDLCGPTALGPSTEYFNAYALMNAEAIYDGQRGVDPDRRVFLLTRSGFAGLQRYSTATWSGDIATRWEDMKAQISAGLNFAMSGIPYWTMDIGGFCVENRYVAGYDEYARTGKINQDYGEWQELNTRWYQFGAFCPLFRAHGQFPYREVWNIAEEGHPCYSSILYYTKLRYRLMPYIYSLAGMTWFGDYTIMRPMVMDFAHDRNVRDIGDQYMFGPALLVAPVYEYGARTRRLYLPEGNVWYDFYSGKATSGGLWKTVPAPYERIPLFVCGGSIVPFGPDIQYVDEKPASEIVLYVYAGKDGSFVLYEDNGVDYGYEKGECSFIRFSYSDAEKTLVIGKREGSYDGMSENRTFRIIYVAPDKPVPAALESGGTVAAYSGEEITVKL